MQRLQPTTWKQRLQPTIWKQRLHLTATKKMEWTSATTQRNTNQQNKNTTKTFTIVFQENQKANEQKKETKQQGTKCHTEPDRSRSRLALKVCRAARGPATLKGSDKRRECRTGLVVTAAVDHIS